MSTPIERMKRKKEEIDMWMELLDYAERVAFKSQTDPMDSDLLGLRVAVKQLQTGRFQ